MKKSGNTENLMFVLWTGIRSSSYGAKYNVIGPKIKRNWKKGIQTCKISTNKAFIFYPEMEDTKNYPKIIRRIRACIDYKEKAITFDKNGS